MNKKILFNAIEYLKGVGTKRADLLKKELGIYTYLDLLHSFPYRYIDRTQFYTIKKLNETSSEVQVIGKIILFKNIKQKRGSRLVATFVDNTATMELVWFRGGQWIQQSLQVNVPYVIFGKVSSFGGKTTMVHPEIETLEAHKKSLQTAMQPMYSSTEKLTSNGITNRLFGTLLQNLFKEAGTHFQETLSNEIIDSLLLISKSDALFNIHFPESQQRLSEAKKRLKFEELFFIQLKLIRKNLVRKHKSKGFSFHQVGNCFTTFYKEHLPFSLTDAQKRVIKEIRKDLGSSKQMNRLLQGDVGSGKTIVALLVMLIAIDNGFQAALMAPTEILATQHFQTITQLLEKMEIRIALLTGSVKQSERKKIFSSLEAGTLHILIGTHALLEDKVVFQNLGLSIIDEQHRFGVAQRARMWKKNHLPPHILIMTATPIPRTLAMSVYGDLDISVINELPPGRKDIKTIHRYDANRLSVFKFLEEEIKKGRQVYVVYPLIKESEAMDYKDLMDGYESMVRHFPAPNYQISIVHGQMKPDAKNYEMQRFEKGETQIMVATTVIEVGVNVPNASIMVVESAERFGLSQLHQLRGRVGRGAEQSYCVLMSGVKLSNEAKTRIKTLVSTNDGFKIAEVDMKLRGPGNLMGTQQSGVLQLSIADLVADSELLKSARSIAIDILEKDPNLEQPENLPIRNTLIQLSKDDFKWAVIS